MSVVLGVEIRDGRSCAIGCVMKDQGGQRNLYICWYVGIVCWFGVLVVPPRMRSTPDNTINVLILTNNLSVCIHAKPKSQTHTHTHSHCRPRAEPYDIRRACVCVCVYTMRRCAGELFSLTLVLCLLVVSSRVLMFCLPAGAVADFAASAKPHCSPLCTRLWSLGSSFCQAQGAHLLKYQFRLEHRAFLSASVFANVCFLCVW